MTMKCNVIKLDGKASGSVELNGSIYGLEVRDDILSRVIHWQLAKRRQGTHETKERGDVACSTRKIVKQKGSGGARHGAKSAPIFRGGGVVFGPHQRSYEYALPKKIKALGLKMALSAKVKSGDLIIVENADIKDAKTKEASKHLKALAPKNACIIDATNANESMTLAIANLHGYDILPTIGANVYDIVRKEKLIITMDALKTLEERLNG